MIATQERETTQKITEKLGKETDKKTQYGVKGHHEVKEVSKTGFEEYPAKGADFNWIPL